MIVTFRPTINTGADYTACYLNFLRCVTAIATAPAGTATLTVNPYTASNTIDTTKNCIISIDANAEAGGWTTSASHNVPSSSNNTPAAYTALASAAAFLYKADFYNASTKATYPFKKLCFHSYNDNTDAQGNYYATYNISGAILSSKWSKSAITASRLNNILITFGCSSSTDWTDTKFPPAAGSASGLINNVTTQSTSWTLNEGAHFYDNQNYRNNFYGLNYTDTTIEYHMAVTADYCVIWESKVGDTYAAGYFTTATDGAGDSSAQWKANYGRFGNIFYMGLRETQAWENSQPDNVPWVAWHYMSEPSMSGTGTVYFPPNGVASFMNTMNNSMVVQTPAKIYRTYNKDQANYFFSPQSTASMAYKTTYTESYKEIDTPLFWTKRMSNTTGNSVNNLYTPVFDAVTGLQVPPAYPIKISRCFSGDFNAGGACRGIYKSLSMPYATIKQIWQAPNQTFTIGTDTYIPFCLDTDMWLVRFA